MKAAWPCLGLCPSLKQSMTVEDSNWPTWVTCPPGGRRAGGGHHQGIRDCPPKYCICPLWIQPPSAGKTFSVPQAHGKRQVCQGGYMGVSPPPLPYCNRSHGQHQKGGPMCHLYVTVLLKAFIPLDQEVQATDASGFPTPVGFLKAK